jgi:hypothetical protein
LQTNPVCHGDSTGTIEIYPEGGTPLYNVSWKDGQTGKAYGLPAGMHTYTVIDRNDCRITGSLRISQPAKIYGKLPEQKTICKNSSVEINAGDFKNSSWVFNEQQLTGATAPTILVSEAGKYIYTGYTPLGCLIADTIEISVSENALETKFIAASEAIAGDTIVAIDLTEMDVDSKQWHIQPLPNILSGGNTYLTAQFDDPGEYLLRLTTTLGACADTEEKVIMIYSSDEAMDQGERATNDLSVISEVKLYPNPNYGHFTVDIALDEEHDLKLDIINLFTGQTMHSKKLKGMDHYISEYFLENLVPGTYSLRVICGAEMKSFLFIKL